MVIDLFIKTMLAKYRLQKIIIKRHFFKLPKNTTLLNKFKLYLQKPLKFFKKKWSKGI